MNWLKSTLATMIIAAMAACAHTPNFDQSQLKESTAWVAYSQDWETEALEVYAEATAAARRIGEASKPGSWAVIMDVDETVMNNVQYQIGRDLAGLGYTPESWYAWTQREDATLVPGAKAFIEAVNAAGGVVALVTNRSDREQLATENNLAALNLERKEDFKILLTRAAGTPSDKNMRFSLVPDMLAVQGFEGATVRIYVGDGRGDKPNTKGNWQFFCIDQGAMYGEPCAETPGTGR